MGIMTYLALVLVTLAGALVQATMGFGAGLIMANFFIMFFPYNKAVALVQATIVAVNLIFTIIYWKKINWRILAPAIIPGAVLGFIFSYVSVGIDMGIMNILIGVLFVGLSIYYLIFADRISIKPNKVKGFLMGTFSGLANAFFGIAGPPIALYLAPALDDKEEYFASLQVFFLFSSLSCIIARLISGVFEVSDIPVLGGLWVVMIGGVFFGLKILRKIEGRLFKRIIYSFIGVNGLYIIIKHLISM